MPTVKLYPNGTDGSPAVGDWPTNSGDRHDAVATSSGTQIAENTNSTTITFLMNDDFENLHAFGAITSVQHSIHAYTSGRTPNTTTIKVEMLDGGDSDTSLYEDTHTVTVDGGWPAEYAGTLRETWDGSNAWTGTKLENLKMKITLVNNDADGNGVAYNGNIDWVYFTVTYQHIYSSTINGLLTLDGKVTIK